MISQTHIMSHDQKVELTLPWVLRIKTGTFPQHSNDILHVSPKAASQCTELAAGFKI